MDHRSLPGWPGDQQRERHLHRFPLGEPFPRPAARALDQPGALSRVEDISGADKTLLEVVDHDAKDDFVAPNAEARKEKQREMEAKLILSSYAKGWTIAENFIAEKNVARAPFEFGYAVGVSRPLALEARPERCNFCPENFQAGLEMYGGLGTHNDFGLRGTSHYVAPVLAWTLANGIMFTVSPGFGLTDSSAGFLLRLGVSYEVAQIGRRARNLFRSGGNQ